MLKTMGQHGHLHLDEAIKQRASASASITLITKTADLQIAHAGSTSNGNASSAQYFVMIGATLVSMNARTCFRISSSPAFQALGDLVKSPFGIGSGFGSLMSLVAVVIRTTPKS